MRFGSTIGLTVLLFLPLPSVLSQSSRSSITVRAIRSAEPLVVDGVLSESVWQQPGLTELRQSRPDEGAEPSQRSEIWTAFDDDALYVAARLYDTSPDSIIQVLGRRDNDVTADWFAFYVDPYYDGRSGYFFALSAAGTMVDGTLYNDDWDDNSWDGVWEGKTSIDDKGWSVEMRIPFSQLRFHQKQQYRWGVNFRRSVGRRSERDFLVYTPRNESGFVSRFADLVGIENINPARQVEILPYINTRAEYTQHLPNDPFNSGSKFLPGLGADLKVGLGSNLTLDATVNPDFGQVEVDPAVVNLSDVETFYQEKRPFFIEGANIFNFGFGGANNYWGFNWGSPDLIYTRRIGRAPQGSLPANDFADSPLGTHILGAAKITGKVGDNWNIGTAHAVTKREFARIESEGRRASTEIEPLTYYGIGRTQKEYNNGRQALGVMATYTKRSFDDPRLRDEINSDALVAGVDGWTFLDSGKTYVVTGWTAFSRVQGNEARMISLQQSSRHYLQRPDASYARVDSNATSLTGFAGRYSINKQSGSIILNAAFGFIDPWFDSNDLGFLWRGDAINGHLVLGYKWVTPTEYYRSVQLRFATFGNFDFEWNKTWHGYFHNGSIEFPNFYNVFWGIAYNPVTVNNRRTRGGPLTLNLPGKEFFFGVNSDSRKTWVAEIFAQTYARSNEPSFSIETSLEWKPAPNLTVRVGPSFSKDRTDAQWIGAYDDPTASATYGQRYVFATLDQTSLSANIRVNWTFTPQLSLQMFVQPLISSGDYHDFKELLQPKSYNFRTYGEEGSTISAATFVADPDGPGPAPAIALENPDFNFKSLRGNAVLRWEYRPGSTLYLVWTQSRAESESLGEFQFNRSLDRLWSVKPDNIFMLKFTYWWSL